MHHNLFIHSSVSGHLGCLHVLAIVIVPQWTLGYMCLFQFWFIHGICLRVGFLMPKSGISYGGFIPSFFKGISILSSIVAVWVYIPTNCVRGFPFLHTLSSIYCLSTFSWWPFWPVWGDIYYTFDLCFSNNEWYWASFHVFVSYLYVFFGEMSV